MQSRSPNQAILVIASETTEKAKSNVHWASVLPSQSCWQCPTLNHVSPLAEQLLATQNVSFSIRIYSTVQQQSGATSSATVPHLPSIDESGLGTVEYGEVTRAVSDVVEPKPAKKSRNLRGTYTKYSSKQREDIG